MVEAGAPITAAEFLISALVDDDVDDRGCLGMPAAASCRAKEPAVVFRSEDRRHAVVNTPDELVCRGCDDAEGSDPLAGGRVPPVLPKARETERRPVLHGDGVWLLYLRAFDSHPLEEAIDRHDAAALTIRLTEHRQSIDRLRLG